MSNKYFNSIKTHENQLFENISQDNFVYTLRKFTRCGNFFTHKSAKKHLFYRKLTLLRVSLALLRVSLALLSVSLTLLSDETVFLIQERRFCKHVDLIFVTKSLLCIKK